MSGKTINTSETKAEALQIQSSVRGGTIAWLRGRTRLSGNLLWFAGFKGIPHTESQGGKGGGGEVRNTTYTYAADVMMAIGHGPVIDIPKTWRGKLKYSGGATAAQIGTVSEAWTVPASGAMTRTLAQAATYLCTIAITAPIDGVVTVLARGRHYLVSAAGVLTVLSDSLRGVALTILYQRALSTINRSGLAQLRLSYISGQLAQSPWSGLVSYPADSYGYSGLFGVAATAYDLGTTAQVENHSFEVIAPGAYHLDSATPDVDPKIVVSEILVDRVAGASFPSEYLGDLQAWSDYCVAAGLLISPAITEQIAAAQVVRMAAELTGAAISTTSGRLQIVPRSDQAETGRGRTYTPDLVPVYDLDDECYTPASDGDPPLKYRRRSTADRYNVWRLEFMNRANEYNVETIEARDVADIAERGVRVNPNTVQAHWICDAAAARKAVQLMLQRSISVLADYEASLPWHYSLLDLVDIVTLSDTRLQMDKVPARVTEISENEEGDLVFGFEDYPIGSASAALYDHPAGIGYQPNWNVAPGSIDTPVIFEGPAQLAGTTGIEVYIAARGVDLNWGGCQVWTSLDGSNYRQIGTIQGPSRYGALSATLGAGGTFMSVNGLGSAQIISGSATDAAQLATLCFVGGAQGEFMAHQAATLTGAGAYNLGSLVRGAYGSPIVGHPNDAVFVRIDDRVARSGPLDPSMVGQDLYIKCLSFNLYGAAPQSLAEVSPVVYNVTGQPASYNPGIGGKGVQLKASSLLFQLPKAGGINPAAITFTAERKGGLLGAATFTVPAGGATLTGTGDTRTLAGAGLTTDSATVRVSITDGLATYTSDVTVAKLREGLDGADGEDADAPVVGLLSNESATVAADNAGTVASFAGAGGSFRVFFGLTEVTGSSTFSLVSSSGVTVAINSAGVYSVNAMAADTGTATLRASFGGINIDKVYSIAKSKAGGAGADAQVLTLNATAQTVTVDGDGDLLPSAQTITFTAVLANLSGTATFTATRYNAAGASLGTVALGGSGNTRTLTGAQFGPDTAQSVTVVASLGGKTDQVTVMRVADGSQGLPGNSAPLLALLATAQTYTFNGAGAAAPGTQTINFTAALQNVSGTATFVCTRFDGSGANLGTVAMGGSGNTRSLSVAQFGGASFATVSATLGGLSDSTTVVRLQDGANGTSPVVSDLTNDSHTVPADSGGNVTSFDGASSTMRVYVGVVDDSANWAYTRTNSAGVGSSISGNTVSLTSFDASAESGYIDVSATRAGYPTQTKRFVLAKARSAPNAAGVLSGYFVGATDPRTFPVLGHAKLRFNSDGTIEASVSRLVGGAYQVRGAWYSPTTAGIGSSYWMKAEYQPGADPVSGGTVGSWVPLSAGQLFTQDASGGEENFSPCTVLFATDSAGTDIVGQCTMTVAATSAI